MKKLKKILLVNWLYFSKELIRKLQVQVGHPHDKNCSA